MWTQDEISSSETRERDVIARIRRYSTLRAAERALQPTVRLRRKHPTAALGLDLLIDLRELLTQVQSQGGASSGGEPDREELDLERVDSRLKEFSRKLEQTIGHTSLAQFRATLRAITRKNRAEATALLDFCLESEGRASRDLALVDYLITLLSSESVRGVKSLAFDPTGVSPALTGLCEREARRADLRCDEAGGEFRSAALEVAELEDLVPLVRRMRRVKNRLGRRFFAPDVLRSIVAYNLAVANRLEALLDAQRSEDAAMERTLRDLRALDEATAAEARSGCPGPQCSVFDSPGISALSDAGQSDEAEQLERTKRRLL
jgi:hypothetical protein